VLITQKKKIKTTHCLHLWRETSYVELHYVRWGADDDYQSLGMGLATPLPDALPPLDMYV
jgi:hypothetical protein